MKAISFTVLLIASGVWAASRIVSSGDLWVALGCGRYILSHGVGRTDPFSFTSPPGAWVNQNWLSHLVFVLLDRLGGLPLLGIWKGMVCTAISFLAASTARALGATRLLALAAGIGVAIVCRPFFDIRPNLHTILLGAVTMRWLIGIERRPARKSWPIVCVMAGWANLHGGFLFGILAVGIASVAVLVRQWRRKTGIMPGRILLITPIVLVLTALLSPYGVMNLVHPYLVSFGPASDHWRNVIEWRPPYGPGALDDPGVRAFWALLSFGTILLLVSRIGRARPAKESGGSTPLIVVALMTLLLSLTSRRFIPLFAVASLPPLAAHVDRTILKRSGPTILWPVAAIIVLTATSIDIRQRLFASNAIWPRSVSWSSRLVRLDEQPRDAVEFILTSHLGGRLLTDWTWGGYLLYRDPFDGDHPRYQIFIDGRAQAAYPVEVSQDWVALSRAAAAGDASAINAFLDYRRIEICLLDRRGSGLAYRIPELDDWVAVYGDDKAVVAVRTSRSDAMITGTFPDEAIAQASAALRLRTQGEMTPEEATGAFRLASVSVQERPTTVGITEMVRLALTAPEGSARSWRRVASQNCDRILADRAIPGTPHEIATLRANTAQSLAALADAEGANDTGRRLRQLAQDEALRADRLARRTLR